MPSSLDGRLALIIGGSGGIGAATARLFAGAGARVVITLLLGLPQRAA